MSKFLFIHYLILLFLLLGGGVLIILLPTTAIHWSIIGFIGLSYIIWAVWHHHDTKTINRQTILEYLCIIGIITLILLLI